MQQRTTLLPKPANGRCQVLSRTPQTPRPLSNESTRIIAALVSALEVKDPRYDLSTYGDFLSDLPKRLGTNKALDASIKAIAISYPSLHVKAQSQEMLAVYLEALRELRTALNKPDKSQTVDILCAIYLTMICQVRHFAIVCSGVTDLTLL